MWQQSITPHAGLALSSLVAALPIIFLFVALISRRIPGYLATIYTLGLALIVAATYYGMPAKLALLSAGYGALNGLFPIGWIVLAAVFLYNLSVRSGSFKIVRETIESITADRRLQALLIAFCFGAFLEGSAGFGAPVAITTGILVGLGFEPLYAAGICLIANTAPVAFGGIGIAIVTAGNLSGIDPNIISQMVAHQLPLLAFILPFWLVAIISGRKGVTQIWPAIFVTGFSYSLTMFLTASYLGPSLPDILSALVSITSLILFLQVWQPKQIWRFPKESALVEAPRKVSHSLQEMVQAWTPFILLILLVGGWGTPSVKALLDKYTLKLTVHGLDQTIHVGSTTLHMVYAFGWLSAAGTAIFIAAIISAILLRLKMGEVLHVFIVTIKELRFPLLTIASIVGFAYVTNYSGMTATLGSALAKTGVLFPFISPLLGWLGTFITGSDTSSNALFSNMQGVTAQHLGVNPVLTVTANTSGGVTGKMISPQSIAVATASSGLAGKEGLLFRFTILHSLALVSIIGVLTYLQAYYLQWMVPKAASSAVSTTSTSLTPAVLTFLGIAGLIVVALAIVNATAPGLKQQKLASGLGE